MNSFRLHVPRVSGQTVRVSWEVDPPSALYWRREFHLEFPSSVDLRPIPEGVWMLVAMLCLHPHWALLRPCRVELPFRLRDGERELWYRLLEATLITLEAHVGRHDFERRVEFVEPGEAAPPVSAIPPADRCASAFSGGKDSLLQAGLLTELTEQPVLVAITSPLPSREDHSTSRRRDVFDTIARRRNVTFVEVRSDFRAAVDYDFAHASAGYAISVTELTDTFLFLSGLIVTSLALGVPHLFLASEAEVQESVECDGRIVQHRHCMYSAVTLQAVSRLVAKYGLQVSSLTSPLYATQVHRLLWTRYRDLCDLQYSCWMVRDGESWCSRCRGCLEYAFGVLALGERPARMGLDLGRVMREVRDWAPRTIDPANHAPTPSQIASQRHSRHVMANARESTTAAFLRAMLFDQPRDLLSPAGLQALRDFRALKRRLDPLAPAAAAAYRPGFLTLVDPLLRGRVGEIYARHFSAEPEGEYADLLARSRALADWVCEPMAASEPPA
jgi:hypothetical protein